MNLLTLFIKTEMVITKPQKFLPQNLKNYLKVLVVLSLDFIKQKRKKERKKDCERGRGGDKMREKLCVKKSM